MTEVLYENITSFLSSCNSYMNVKDFLSSTKLFSLAQDQKYSAPIENRTHQYKSAHQALKPSHHAKCPKFCFVWYTNPRLLTVTS